MRNVTVGSNDVFQAPKLIAITNSLLTQGKLSEHLRQKGGGGAPREYEMVRAVR